MEIAPDAVEVKPEASGKRFAWATDNPIGRAIGRVPLPLGAKLVAAFSVIAALLAVGYVLGFVALRQANLRSDQLRRLQQQAAYEQLLVADATQLKNAVYRLSLNGAASPTVTAANRGEIGVANTALCADAGLGGRPGCLALPRTGVTLAAIDPPLLQLLRSTFVGFDQISGDDPTGYTASTVTNANRVAAVILSRLTKLANGTGHEARALVAQNHSSYDASRNLLVGVGAGTVVLILGLGLVLSGSVVVPIRRTRMRLAGIAAGDFSTQVEVPNRDEIGGLAADVNSMSAELKRVHRELELASEHKSQFVANMSHELRTPLNAIIGFSDVLHEEMFGELNERQLAYVEDIREAGKHQLSLINEILDLAKIEAGKMELELSQVAIPDLLRSAVSMQSERASRRGIELSLTCNPEEITIMADERRVRQAVFNLLSNAVKFTPENGHVDLFARIDDGYVEIAVADTGPGIPAEHLDTVFEEFAQTTEGKQLEGTGLGLPLSRKLVELHGGRLWAESQPGHGSTFRFTLPLRQETARETADL